MFSDDNVVEESTSAPTGQVVPLWSINFEVTCTIDPAHPGGKPVCKLKYKPKPGEDAVVETNIEEDDDEDSTDDEDGKTKKLSVKKKRRSKKSRKDEDGHGDEDLDDDDEDEDDDDESPVLRCVAESFDPD